MAERGRSQWACRCLAVAATFFGLLLTHPAAACAPPPPSARFVSIDGESAVIVWDAARHVEHFIRRAAFRTDAPDFGFLVPTPTKPELAALDDVLFDRLEQLTRPELRAIRVFSDSWIASTTGNCRSPATRHVSTSTHR